MSRVYYNEYDAFAAAWLRNLMQAGLIPEGDVDERSILDVRADDLRAYRQCHFFAGIGGWSHALRLAGWSDDRPIWTGSCPCQPFSVAGKGKGKDDERHLWPVFHKLITECRPPVVMGEQVAGKAGYGWFDGVRADLEGEDYAARAVDIPACAVNAPHIRQRLYWCAVNLGHADRARPQGHGRLIQQHDAQGWQEPDGRFAETNIRDDMGYANGSRSASRVSAPTRRSEGFAEISDNGSCGQSGPWEECCDMADAKSDRHQEWEWQDRQQNARSQRQGGMDIAGNNQSFWHNADWITGADGKTRRAKPGVRLLVDGVPNRVGRLRGYGNAIVPPLAAEVIKAFMEVMP